MEERRAKTHVGIRVLRTRQGGHVAGTVGIRRASGNPEMPALPSLECGTLENRPLCCRPEEKSRDSSLGTGQQRYPFSVTASLRLPTAGVVIVKSNNCHFLVNRARAGRRRGSGRGWACRSHARTYFCALGVHHRRSGGTLPGSNYF